MRILMIAPEPFFEPRGTPFSEFHRIRALTALGHTVDLVTYPFGEDVTMAGLRVFRAIRPPFVHRVKIGPSLAKLPLDFFLTFTALRRLFSSRYDAIHSHEEGGLIGVVLAALFRTPHLYDMHSSLPQQLANFSFSRSPIIRSVFTGIERLMIRRSRVVIVICPALEETVRAIEPGAEIVLIENAPGSAEEHATPEQGRAVRAQFGFRGGAGRPLHRHVREATRGSTCCSRRWPASRRCVRTRDCSWPAASPIRSAAPWRTRPPRDCRRHGLCRRAAGFRDPAYLQACDVLVSRARAARTRRSRFIDASIRKPIVATRLLTHTQVLSDETAF